MSGCEGKLESSAPWQIRFRPDAATMGVDDRAADRQTHAHTAVLGREKWLEHSVHNWCVEADARVRDSYQHTGACVCPRSYRKHSWLIQLSHCFNAVHDEVQQHL